MPVQLSDCLTEIPSAKPAVHLCRFPFVACLEGAPSTGRVAFCAGKHKLDTQRMQRCATGELLFHERISNVDGCCASC